VLASTTYYDPMGRPRLVDNGVSRVQKAYRYGTGVNYELTSNPFAAASSNNSEATMGWTRTTRDSLNRVTSVAHYGGGTPPAPWGSRHVHGRGRERLQLLGPHGDR
jgi:hypothetical protein